MSLKFVKAERKQAKLRLALAGPSGSGKTFSALLLAKGLGGRVAVIDTEQGSASLYSHLHEFDALNLTPPYTPERYIEAIQTAEQAGYDTLIIDSITHEWDGVGGCLEINERLAGAKYRGNTWSAWSETTPRHRAFLDTILQSKLHVIATMRSKVETAQNEQKKVVKVGVKAIQREGAEYEFTTVLELTHSDHLATVSKDRTGLFRDPEPITPETGRRLLAWLNAGAKTTDNTTHEPAPKPAPVLPPKADTPPAAPAADPAGPVKAVADSQTAVELEAAVFAAKAMYERKALDVAGMKAVCDAVQSKVLHLVRACGTPDALKGVWDVYQRGVVRVMNQTRQAAIQEAFDAKDAQLAPPAEDAAPPADDADDPYQ